MEFLKRGLQVNHLRYHFYTVFFFPQLEIIDRSIHLWTRLLHAFQIVQRVFKDYVKSNVEIFVF